MPDNKERDKPLQLQYIEIYKRRCDLSEEEERYLYALNAGYEGECAVDQWIESSSFIQSIIIRDLQMEIDRKSVQFDTLLITDSTIILFEIKHYRGDYEETGEGTWITPANKEITSPFNQLDRSIALIKRFLEFRHFRRVHVEGYIVCPHPEFHLFGSEKKMPLITFSRWKRWIELKKPQLAQTPGKTAIQLENALKSGAISKGKFLDKRKFCLEDVVSGVFCTSCSAIMTRQKHCTNYHCNSCGHSAKTSQIVKQLLFESHVLFPDQRIDSRAIYLLSGKTVSLRSIQRYLE